MKWEAVERERESKNEHELLLMKNIKQIHTCECWHFNLGEWQNTIKGSINDLRKRNEAV